MKAKRKYKIGDIFYDYGFYWNKNGTCCFFAKKEVVAGHIRESKEKYLTKPYDGWKGDESNWGGQIRSEKELDGFPKTREEALAYAERVERQLFDEKMKAIEHDRIATEATKEWFKANGKEKQYGDELGKKI